MDVVGRKFSCIKKLWVVNLVLELIAAGLADFHLETIFPWPARLARPEGPAKFARHARPARLTTPARLAMLARLARPARPARLAKHI